MPLQGPDPALVRDHNRDRLALDKGFLDRGKIMLRRVGEIGAALAERRLRPEEIANGPHLLADLGPLLRFRAERSEEHTSELQSRPHLVCRLLLEKKKQ